MADVLLQECVTQLRERVHAGQYSDAFTLGQHILHYFPKHIDTYVVLAQASLESDDLAGATDLFRRVLSADPENVLALAGMALINEAQDKHDEALWYLERAYEIQPTNDELRRELVRVRELYYGTSAERLELTSGALARIYARQGQYTSAINEFRRVLRAETKRYDVRVALAESLYRAGRTNEAAQVAQSIMADAPYSLKPNLILGALWSENAVPEGQQYLSRAYALDPEQRIARDLIGARFAQTQPPRLPSLDAQVAPSKFDDQVIGLAHGEPSTVGEAARQAERLRDLERAFEFERVEQAPRDYITEEESEPLEFAAANDFIPEVTAKQETVAQARADVTRLAAVESATPPGETAAPPVDATLEAIAEAEQELAPPPSPPPAPEKAPSQFAQRVTRKSEAIPTDAIAAAAAALATSIAVDKLKQPAPARRAHPALPKVRPVIRGAAEKLPPWLRLGATPAAASASFEVAPPTPAERIEPIATPSPAAPTPKPDDRPEWLVQAQAASQETAAPVTSDTDMPDWLRPPAPPPAVAETVSAPEPVQPPDAGVPAATEPAIPEWLREAHTPETPAPAPIAEQEPAAAPLPEWLTPETTPSRPTLPFTTESPAAVETSMAASQAAEPTPPVVSSAEESEPPTMRVETKTDAQELPDWRQTPATAETQPAPAPIAEKQPPAPVAEKQPPAPQPPPVQEKPLDALTLIGNARARRANQDLKGALDLYERAMHRRPNHLDEIIVDLQDIVKSPNIPPSAHRLLGEAFAMAGRFKESLEQYRIAMGK